MLKQGTIHIEDAEYTLYELQVGGFYRLDITVKGAEFHIDAASVLFSCYGKKRRRQFGDVDLYQKYIETMGNLKRMTGQTVTKTKWENGVYIITERKGETGKRLVTETRDGELIGELYELEGITIVLRVVDVAFKTVLLPINDKQYQYSDTQDKKPKCLPLSVLRARHNINWEKRTNYKVASTLIEADAALFQIDDTFDGKPIGFDTITMNRDSFTDVSELAGIVVSPMDGASFYFPFRSLSFDVLPLTYFYEYILPVLQKKTCLITHDKKHAKTVLFKMGTESIDIKHSSLLLSKMLDPDGDHSIHAIGTVVRKDQEYLSLSELYSPHRKPELLALDKEYLRIYACPVADNSRRYYEVTHNKISACNQIFYERECKLADLKAEQDYFGLNNEPDSTEHLLISAAYEQLETRVLFALANEAFPGESFRSSVDETLKCAYQLIRQNINAAYKTERSSTYFGRERVLNRGFDELEAGIYPIQGTITDIIQSAETALDDCLSKSGLKESVDTPEGKYPLARVKLSGNGEFLISWHKSLPAETAVSMIKHCMDVEVNGYPLIASVDFKSYDEFK